MAESSRPEIVGKAYNPTIEPPPSATEPEGLSLGKALLQPRSILSFAVSLGIIVFVFARQDIPFEQVWANIRRANPFLYLLGFLAYYATFLVRSYRWQQVLHNAGYSPAHGVHIPPLPTLTRIIFLSWFANSVLPAKLGDGYRGYLLKRNSGVSFYKTMGTIVAERIADVGILFSLLLGSGLLAFQDDLPPNFGKLMAFGAVLAIASLSTLFFLKQLGPWIVRVLPARIKPLYKRLEEGVLLAYRDRMALILLLTALVWILESARFWFVAAALGKPFSVSLVVFIALAASLLTTVPFTPAGLGVVEGAVVAVLLLVIDDKSLAGSIALLDRTITYWSILLFGAIVYLRSPNK